MLNLFLEVGWERIAVGEDEQNVPVDVPREKLGGRGCGWENDPPDDFAYDERVYVGGAEGGEELGDGDGEGEELEGTDWHFRR
jgi:hypothetical protein